MAKRRHEGESTPPGSPASATDFAEAQVDVLLSELEEARQKVEEEHGLRLRALADFANLKRRQEEDARRLSQYSAQELILRILPALDNFELALNAAEANHSYKSLVEGVKLTLRQVREVLESEGVRQIESVGREFDPMLHEAVMRVETDDYPENTVVEELQCGYTLGDRVIRPARVRVAVAPPE